jgi:predicted transcriptional regulator
MLMSLERFMEKAFTLRIDSAMFKKLEQLAAKDDRSIAYVIRQAIKEYVAKKGAR